ncbi:collagen-like protein [Streptomyces sp. NPDC006551]|uniref:collagen-like protein n=1 Tax=Streptomyces sp. NPDC006551 TaxID=3157178 RepID=UPI0033B197A6
MSRTERFLAARWRGLATLCALVALFGIASILWARMDARDRAYNELATEADLRGNAVTTLATDVRKLRSQLESEGKTPVAPDPTAAVDDLPDRAAVPVPIPGAKGEKGDKGDPGEPAPTPSPGASGLPGVDGKPGRDGVDGVDGKDGSPGQNGKDGRDGTNGVDGKDGQPPAGWTWTDPQGVTYSCVPVDNFDPAAPRYTCTYTSSPDPDPDPAPPGQQRQSVLTVLGLAPDRRRY